MTVKASLIVGTICRSTFPFVDVQFNIYICLTFVRLINIEYGFMIMLFMILDGDAVFFFAVHSCYCHQQQHLIFAIHIIIIKALRTYSDVALSKFTLL